MRRIFPTIAGAVLVLTGAAKLASAFGSAKLLSSFDPVFGIQFHYLMLGSGTIELVVGYMCFFTKMQSAMFFVAWLATNLVAYRLSLWQIGWRRPCSCLGNLTDAIHVSPVVADNVMKVMLAYLLIGSYASLFWLWRQHRNAVGGMMK